MKKSTKTRLVGHLVYGLFRLLYSTYRFRHYGLPYREEARRLSATGSVALGIWHRNMLGCIFGSEMRRLCILVSQSTDGEIISRVVAPFGIKTVRGSSTRGGREALDELKALPPGAMDVGITVDGPLGPIYKAKAGIFVVAMKTGMTILPMAAAPRREWILHKSWDKYRVPKPFTEILCAYGPPITVPEELSEEGMKAIKASLEATLTQLDRQLDAWLAGRVALGSYSEFLPQPSVPG